MFLFVFSPYCHFCPTDIEWKEIYCLLSIFQWIDVIYPLYSRFVWCFKFPEVWPWCEFIKIYLVLMHLKLILHLEPEYVRLCLNGRCFHSPFLTYIYWWYKIHLFIDCHEVVLCVYTLCNIQIHESIVNVFKHLLCPCGKHTQMPFLQLPWNKQYTILCH